MSSFPGTESNLQPLPEEVAAKKLANETLAALATEASTLQQTFQTQILVWKSAMALSQAPTIGYLFASDLEGIHTLILQTNTQVEKLQAYILQVKNWLLNVPPNTVTTFPVRPQ